MMTHPLPVMDFYIAQEGHLPIWKVRTRGHHIQACHQVNRLFVYVDMHALNYTTSSLASIILGKPRTPSSHVHSQCAKHNSHGTLSRVECESGVRTFWTLVIRIQSLCISSTLSLELRYRYTQTVI